MYTFFNDNKTNIYLAILVVIVICYFLIDYQIKTTLRSEIMKIHRKKYKKKKLQKIREEQLIRDNNVKQDIDSYVDPANNYQENKNDVLDLQ